MGFIVKNTTFPSLLDLIIPHSCRGCGHTGSILCNRCKNNIILDHLEHPPKLKLPKSFPPTFIVSDRAGLVNVLIHDFKYNSARALATSFAEILHQILPPLPPSTVIVPLPTVQQHIRARGLDHTYLIAKKLAKLSGCHIERLLIRNNNTVQVGSDRKTRLMQAQSAYLVNPDIKINPATTYLLFDDVWTTGASMQAAIKRLRQAGAKNIIVALLAVSRLEQKWSLFFFVTTRQSRNHKVYNCKSQERNH